MNRIRVAATLLLIAGPAHSQNTSQLTPSELEAFQAANATAIPASCDAPLALQQMMTALQEDVGDRINDQIVNILAPKTIYIKPDGYECQIVTVWGQSPPVLGLFKRYVNAVGKTVYSWDGEKQVPGYPGS